VLSGSCATHIRAHTHSHHCASVLCREVRDDHQLHQMAVALESQEARAAVAAARLAESKKTNAALCETVETFKVNHDIATSRLSHHLSNDSHEGAQYHLSSPPRARPPPPPRTQRESGGRESGGSMKGGDGVAPPPSSRARPASRARASYRTPGLRRARSTKSGVHGPGA
jgi:hypothetical protein